MLVSARYGLLLIVNDVVHVRGRLFEARRHQVLVGLEVGITQRVPDQFL